MNMPTLLNVLLANLLMSLTILLSGCGGTQNYLPSIQFYDFSPPKLETKWEHFNAKKLKLTIGLLFKYNNPTSFPLPIPGHEFSFTFDDSRALVIESRKPAFTVPPREEKIVEYAVMVDLANIDNRAIRHLLGRDVPYKLEAKFSLPSQLGSNTDSFVLLYENKTRFPYIPVVEFDQSQRPHIKFTGDIKEIDLSSIRNVMKPFFDNYQNRCDENCASVINTLLPGLGDLINGWDGLLALPSTIIDPIESNITGMTFSIPLVIENPNEFAISAPEIELKTDVTNGDGSVFSFSTDYFQDNPKVPRKIGRENGKQTLNIKGTFDWTKLGIGLQALVLSDGLTVKANGAMKMDLGYGPTDVQFKIEEDVSFRFGNP